MLAAMSWTQILGVSFLNWHAKITKMNKIEVVKKLILTPSKTNDINKSYLCKIKLVHTDYYTLPLL